MPPIARCGRAKIRGCEREVSVMVRKMMLLTCTLAVFGWTAPTIAGGCEGCEKVVKTGNGFCCGHGQAFGVALTSQKLYDALQGAQITEADAAKCPCPDCKTAMAAHGSCDRCKMTGKKMYGSPVAYALAKGFAYDSETVAACPKRCEQCKSAFQANGQCEHCGVGFVAGHMFEDSTAYKIARAAFDTLKKAAVAASKCEGCAIAIVTDGKCAKCDVRFQGGRVARDDG